ncbi:MAG: GNAT family N-acetyltransferase, partial [Thermoanaerobaculia bacterium]
MRQRLETILAATDEHTLLVAIIDEEVVGWINLSVVTALESGSFAEIRGLVVTEKHRGARVGSQLV